MSQFGVSGTLEINDVSGAQGALNDAGPVTVEVDPVVAGSGGVGGGSMAPSMDAGAGLDDERNELLGDILDELQEGGGLGGGGGGGGDGGLLGGGLTSLLGGATGGGGAAAGGGLLGGGALATGGTIAGGALAGTGLSVGALVGLEKFQRDNADNEVANRGAEAGQQAIQSAGGVPALMGAQGPGQIGLAIGEQLGDAAQQRLGSLDFPDPFAGIDAAVSELDSVDPLSGVEWPDAPDPLSGVDWPQPPDPFRGIDWPEPDKPGWLDTLERLFDGGSSGGAPSRPGRQSERPRINNGTDLGPFNGAAQGLNDSVESFEQRLNALEEALLTGGP